MMKVSDIATKVIEEEDDFGDTSFAIKARIENDSEDEDVYIELQGIDSDGFEIHEVVLSGKIPLGGSRVLTTKDDVNMKLFDQIAMWQQK
ncbi:MAG: hypothetical protein RRC34_06345 [Lentisphaeria bacterium]|nr:hypothetical protein [Lentisphaeria bacterium]